MSNLLTSPSNTEAGQFQIPSSAETAATRPVGEGVVELPETKYPPIVMPPSEAKRGGDGAEQADLTTYVNDARDNAASGRNPEIKAVWPTGPEGALRGQHLGSAIEALRGEVVTGERAQG